jgi:hypothetical protein
MTAGSLMDLIAVWCGFVGAWVLVAGPLYQGAVELSEVKVDVPALRAQAIPLFADNHPWTVIIP